MSKGGRINDAIELLALRILLQQYLAMMALEYEKAGRGTPQSCINIIAANCSQMALSADVQRDLPHEVAHELKQDIADRIIAILSEIKFPSDRSNVN
jgi:hypothetical protein